MKDVDTLMRLLHESIVNGQLVQAVAYADELDDNYNLFSHYHEYLMGYYGIPHKAELQEDYVMFTIGYMRIKNRCHMSSIKTIDTQMELIHKAMEEGDIELAVKSADSLKEPYTLVFDYYYIYLCSKYVRGTVLSIYNVFTKSYLEAKTVLKGDRQ